MNARPDAEIRELLGFLDSKDSRMREIAVKVAACFKHPDGVEALLLIGLADENPVVARAAATELQKTGKICICGLPGLCSMEPVKRKSAVISKASELENKPLAAALLSYWLADSNEKIAELAERKLVDLGAYARSKMERLASGASCGRLRSRAASVTEGIDLSEIKKAFRRPKDAAPGKRPTAFQKIRTKIKNEAKLF